MSGLRNLLLAPLTHLLARENWARERLRPFAGAVLCIEGGPLTLALRIDEHGLLVQAEPESPADVTLTLPADAPLRLLVDRPSLFAGIRLAGAADIAEALAFVFRNLRWDVEEDLARLVGDIPARRLTLLASRLGGEARTGVQRLLTNVSEYATEEVGILAGKRDIVDFAAEVDRLRDDLARLEQRIQRL